MLELAQSTDLPLACAGTHVGSEEPTIGNAVIGIVLALATQGERPVAVDPARLRSAELSHIPDSVWSSLEDLDLPWGEEAEDDFPLEGLFLCPVGWSTGALMLGEIKSEFEDDELGDMDWEGEVEGEEVASAAAEDMDMTVRWIDAGMLEQIEASSAALVLEANYN